MSLNAGALLFDGTGRIRNAAVPPTDFNGGTPTIQGLLTAAASLPAVYLGGLGYSADVLSWSSGTIDHHVAGGIPVLADGSVAISASNPTYWHAGLPFASTGHISVGNTETPGSMSGFSNGFSNGFG